MPEEKKNPLETRSKIISFLKIRGPSLPIHISRETGVSTLFAGAFLSELASNSEVKISSMKVGGSPLYFLPGQESQLENFSNYLQSKEKEAFSVLKEKKLLEDRKLEPAIRVALRSIKDFAFPLLLNSPEQILFWRFYSLPEEEAKLLVEKLIVKPIQVEIKKKVEEKKQEIKPDIKVEKPKPQIKEIKEEKPDIKKEEVEKPLLTIKEQAKKPGKEKSNFVNKIINFLESESIELIEEKEYKKKEYEAKIRINSDIGKISFLLIAKDKKTITENDLTIALQKAQSSKMPSFLISTGSLNKKAQAYLDSYSSLIKFRRI
jgi:hypothetical protein